MKKLGILFTVFVFLVTIAPSAFGAAKMSRLEIRVWPEYDNPGILIMQTGSGITGAKKAIVYFPNTTQNFQVLKKIITNNDTNPDQYAQKFTSKSKDKFTELTFEIPRGEYFAEGYWNGYKINQDKKTFTYVYKMPFDVDQVYVYFQKPATATDFLIDPKPQYTKKNKQNLEISSYSFSNKKAGEEIKFTVSYTKKDNELSYNQINKTGSSSSSTASSNTTDVAVVILVVLLLGFLTAGGFSFYSRRKVSEGYYRERSLRSGRGGSLSKGGRSSLSSSSKKGKVKFCPKCGAKTQGNFCANCGRKLR